jgi:hypothetical protein
MTIIESSVCFLGVAAAIWIAAMCLALCYEAATTAGQAERHRDLAVTGDPEDEAAHCCWAQFLFCSAEGTSLVLDGIIIDVRNEVTTPVGTPFSMRIAKPGHDLPRMVLRLRCLARGGDKVLLQVRDIDGRPHLRLRRDGLDLTVPLECAAGWPVLDPYGGDSWS